MTGHRRTTREATDRAAGAIRLLLLEEDPGDAELVRAAFRADGFGCSVTKVERVEDLDAALAAASFDVVVSGAGGRGRDPLLILRTSRRRRADLPVVFFSASSSQELAVELLKAGATDFVAKNRILELVPSIDRALWEAAGARERAASEAALADSERRYRSIVEQAVRWNREMEAESRLS
jgi:DNA-binding NtrC family response regulator